MPIESTSKFTAPAAKLWAAIPADTQKILLSNVWCGKCRHEITITHFTGAVKAGDLLLVGKCSECHGDVARVIGLKGSAGGSGAGELGHDLVLSKEKLISAQALLEVKQLVKEADVLLKRYMQLLIKKDGGAITNDEEAEFDRLENQELIKITQKLSGYHDKLLDAKNKCREQG